MKKEVGKLVATPSKRLFLSIIADYDLNRSICGLVDNGLDVGERGGRTSKINIGIVLDSEQTTISVQDNAGGLPPIRIVLHRGGQTKREHRRRTKPLGSSALARSAPW